MRKSFIVLCALLLTAGTLQAEVVRLEPVVVTATRVGTPLSQIASSVTVITAEEIEAKQQTQVLDVLRSVPGVHIVQTGSMGGQTSIFLRGTDTRHTLLLIDGIEYRDASSAGGGPSLENLSTINIAQIEIVRGAQSVLYGSDAIGGVINIITKKSSKQPEGYASIEGGSYNTWTENAGFSTGNKTASSSFAISRTDSDGFSAANKKDGNTEEDGFKNTTVSFNLAVKPTQTFDLNLNAHLTDAENEFDNFFSGIASDADNINDSQEKTGKITGIFHLFDDHWQISLSAAVTDTSRDTMLGTYNYGYEGKITKFDLLNTIHVGQHHTLVVGTETEKEEYNSYADFEEPTHEKATTDAIFIQDQFTAGNFVVSVGARHDEHEEFGGKTTWRLAPSYTFVTTGTKLKSAIGTGFKAPSLYQLHHPYFGNINLKAEESLGYDIGMEQSVFDNAVIMSLTWFYNDIKDHIEFDDIGWTGYYQGGDIKTKGVETTVNIYPSELIDVQLNYTYTDTKDDNGSRLRRRPLHKGSFDLNLHPLDAINLSLSAVYVGERDDSGSVVLDAYTLVNLTTSYQINDNFKIFGRIDNLFDKDYEEVAGYGTAGLSGYAGIKLSF
jgi:vitamin B12 transporter